MSFQHKSGKLGQNFADDHASRNPMICIDKESCKICNFVQDCSKLMVDQISFRVTDNFEKTIIGQIDINKDNTDLINAIIRGDKTIPFANKQAMVHLQSQDPVLNRVRQLLLAGETPHPGENSAVKRYMRRNVNLTIASDGCLIVTKSNNKLVTRKLIVVPEDISLGLLQGLHLHLNHPSPTQMQRAIDTKFFLLDRFSEIHQIWENCTLCQSIAKLPVEIKSFDPNKMPEHPGLSFTVDILRASKKYIMVAMENFSGFLSTSIIKVKQQSHCSMDFW